MIKKVVTVILMGFINFYRLCCSPFLPHTCRFIPSCSDYALEAIKIHGIIKGSCLTFKRLLRCHPWGEHGVDEVPRGKQEGVSENKREYK